MIFPNPFIYYIFYINHLQLKESILHYNFDNISPKAVAMGMALRKGCMH